MTGSWWLPRYVHAFHLTEGSVTDLGRTDILYLVCHVFYSWCHHRHGPPPCRPGDRAGLFRDDGKRHDSQLMYAYPNHMFSAGGSATFGTALP